MSNKTVKICDVCGKVIDEPMNYEFDFVYESRGSSVSYEFEDVCHHCSSRIDEAMDEVLESLGQ